MGRDPEGGSPRRRRSGGKLLPLRLLRRVALPPAAKAPKRRELVLLYAINY